MTNLFKFGGPYEIAVTQYGSSLADLPIKFARQFGATFGTVDWMLGAALGGFVLYYLVERFLKTTPRKALKGVFPSKLKKFV